MQFFGLQTQQSARNQSGRCSSLDCTSEAGEESQPNAAFELHGGLFDDPVRLLNPVSAAFGMHAKGFWPLQLENAAQMSPSLLHVCCAQLTGN